MRESADVAVVGAGPAGATCAAMLASNGIDVAVIDQYDFPREKPCGDGLTPRAVGYLQTIGLGRLVDAAQPIATCRLIVDQRRERVVKRYDDRSPARCLPREQLDRALLDVALRSGATFLRGRATSLAGRADVGAAGVHLDVGRKKVTFDAARVVACDGATSVLRRSAGLGTPGHAVRAWAIRGYYRVEHALEPSFDVFVPLEVHGTSLLGYGWVFPVDEHRANIGIGYFRPPGVGHLPRFTDALNTFVEALRSRGHRRYGDLEPASKPIGAPIGINFDPRRCATESLVLVGDAAGTTDPFTGEGIEPAMHSGRIAAQAVEASLKRGVPLAPLGRGLARHMPRMGQDFSSVARALSRDRLSEADSIGPATIRQMRFVASAVSDAPHSPIAEAQTPIVDWLSVSGFDDICRSLVDDHDLQDGARTTFPLVSSALAAEMRSHGGPVYAVAAMVAAKACGSDPDERVITAARAVEYLAPFAEFLSGMSAGDGDIHTLNNALATLTADFTVSKAMVAAATLGCDGARLLALAAREMCEGGMMDERARFDLARTRERYLAAVELRHASVFALAVVLGATISGAPSAVVDRVGRFGRALGVAHRLSEEVRALATLETAIPVLKQAARYGAYVLPILVALEHSVELRKQFVAGIDEDAYPCVVEQLHETGAIAAVADVAGAYGATAIDALGPRASSTPTHLSLLAEWVLSRVPTQEAVATA